MRGCEASDEAAGTSHADKVSSLDVNLHESKRLPGTMATKARICPTLHPTGGDNRG